MNLIASSSSSFFLFLLGFCLAQDVGSKELTYEIKTTWNGEPLDHDPARVTFSTDVESGDLEFKVSAQFFNSPIQGEKPIENCPARTYFGLYRYEVMRIGQESNSQM